MGICPKLNPFLHTLTYGLVFWLSTYPLMVSELTLPAVLTKWLRVQRLGMALSLENSSLNFKEVAPSICFMIFGMLIVGSTLTKICTWSMWHSNARILIPHLSHSAMVSFLNRYYTPRILSVFLLYRGQNTKW